MKNWIKFKITGNYKCSFKYYLNHIYNYNIYAINNNHWKLWDLFHDIEKPWLNLFLPYKTVRRIHRKIHIHHFKNIWGYVSKRQMIYDEFSHGDECDAIKKLINSNYINIQDINKYIKHVNIKRNN